MKNRIITGISLGTLWLFTLIQGEQNFFWLLVVIICALGLYEFFTIALTGHERIYRPVAIIIGIFPLLIAQTGRLDFVQTSFILSLFAATILAVAASGNQDNNFLFMAKIITGLSLIGLTAAHIVLLMALPDGTHWLIILTLIIAASDTGAYFTGTALGRHKLCPGISPGKTVEGFIGGLAAAIVVTLLSGPLLFTDISLYRLVFLAFTLSCLGVTGDLTESIFKRSNNVKDSGGILPGHGGILDRVDSILTAGPALYYIVKLGII